MTKQTWNIINLAVHCFDTLFTTGSNRNRITLAVVQEIIEQMKT